MNEEEILRQLTLNPPSDMLDRRVAQLLAEPPARGPLLARPVSLWQCLAACAACALLAFMAGAMRLEKVPNPAPTTEVRYVLQVQQHPFNVFDWTQYPKASAPGPVLQAVQSDVDKTEI